MSLWDKLKALKSGISINDGDTENRNYHDSQRRTMSPELRGRFASGDIPSESFETADPKKYDALAESWDRGHGILGGPHSVGATPADGIHRSGGINRGDRDPEQQEMADAADCGIPYVEWVKLPPEQRWKLLRAADADGRAEFNAESGVANSESADAARSENAFNTFIGKK